jgi:galactonate dehydratase
VKKALISEVESFVVGDAHVVRIRADDGAYGVGQSGCWAYPDAVHSIVKTFEQYLLGRDPSCIESHWHHMHRMGAFRGSVLGGAVSAVDIALWDLKAKRLDVPVWELLGGRYRDRIRLLYLLEGEHSIDAIVEAASDAVAEGFTAFKFSPLPRGYFDKSLDALINEATGIVQAVREVVGSDVDLVLELGKAFAPLHARPLLRSFEGANPLFVEDAIPIDSIELQAAIARETSLALGHGERLHTIWEFNDLLARGGTQYLRACPGLAGGISHCRKIAAIAEAYHAPVVWHNYQGPILTAACVQLDTVMPNFVVQEYHPSSDEGELASGYSTTHKRVGGDLIISDAAGLGVDFDESQLAAADFTGREHLWTLPTRHDGSVAFAV